MISKKKAGLFSPIHTQEDAEREVSEAVKGFYALAGIQLALIGFLSVMSETINGDLFDPIFLASNAWIIQKNKSRFLSLIIFVYSLSIFGITLMNMFGEPVGGGFGGSNIILVALLLYISFRCIQGTYINHKLLRTTINRREALLRSILIPVYTVAVSIIVLIGVGLTDVGQQWLVAPDRSASDALLGFTVIIPALITAYATALGKLPFTGRTPLTVIEVQKA